VSRHAVLLPSFAQAIILACHLSLPPVAGAQRGGGRGALAREGSEGAEVEQAVAAVAGASSQADIRELFARHLKLRAEVVPAADKPKYWRELKAKPELKNIPLYGADSEQSQAALKVIRPVLGLYGRDWDVAVIKQGASFAGTFRQCILIVSTGLLQLVTDEELRGFAAHELAHECFIEELREADRSHCAAAYRLVEYKSDLVAALALLLVRGDTLALASGVEKVEAYYLGSEPSVLQDETHPDSAHRRRCIELFLARIREARVLMWD
jgi:hypothetical protein